MSAVSEVLGVTELFEQILSELPPLDIIRYQRVSRTWQNLIVESPLLQYKTWQRKDHSNPVKADDLIPDLERKDFLRFDSEERKEYELPRFIYNVSKHLHPILVS
ncbi:hypothetical protein P280DRAFT_520148 [Massarina eburnea CBS 473.64]|uniref:F-box domain-containing protein n=1 Tax=Massarina eburnea CBS 473.64 TaxID=1395130 RepID=A0A6A6RUM7_9PLEO|nr:hypothetical protein P280DRAFT_520148 [Massarina eburnea CBS 473.64]